jgi:hypothetical protein
MKNPDNLKLSTPIKRKIKAKEKYLGKTCQKVWTFGNSLGERYIFGKFAPSETSRKDAVVVTLALFDSNIQKFTPVA